MNYKAHEVDAEFASLDQVLIKHLNCSPKRFVVDPMANSVDTLKLLRKREEFFHSFNKNEKQARNFLVS